jgi:hypothetical protein
VEEGELDETFVQRLAASAFAWSFLACAHSSSLLFHNSQDALGSHNQRIAVE